MVKQIRVGLIKPNPNNPRIIKDEKFQKLVQSIRNFPEMLEARPIVVNQDMVVLGGNMRLKAIQEVGLKEVPVEIVDWDEAKQAEFTIKDNVNFGDWDYDALANDWEQVDLADWGMDVWQQPVEVDYSMLDDEGESDIQTKLDEMVGGVKRGILIEFEPEHFDEATALIKFWREKEAYIGRLLIEKLKEEKDKL